MVHLGLLMGLAIGVGGSCQSSGVFECSADGDCVVGEIGGSCQSNGYCSFPSDDCDSGQEYGQFAPSGVAGTCVPTAGTGSSGAPVGSSSGDIVVDDSGSSSGGVGDTTTNMSTTTDDATSTGEPPVDEDLVLWLTFDEGGRGTIPDQSGHGNDGLCGDVCPPLVPGVIGSAGAFGGGANNVVAVLFNPEFDSSAFTLAMWIRPYRLEGAPMAIIEMPLVSMTSWNSWELRLDDVNAMANDIPHRLFFAVANEMSQSVIEQPKLPFRVNDWVHLAGVSDGMSLTLYLDGAEVMSQGNFGMQVDGQDVFIGAGLSGPMSISDWFDGELDDLRYYRRALSPAEIASLADAER